MSEKIRSMNSGGDAGSSNAGGSGGGGGIGPCSIIGAPTLISSTYSTSLHHPHPMIPSSLLINSSNSIASPRTGSSTILSANSFAGGSDTESTAAIADFPPASIVAQLNFQLLQDFAAGDNNSIMNSSQISATSNDSIPCMAAAAIGSSSINSKPPLVGSKHLPAQSVSGKSLCRFPKLEECAHFHYERVQLGPLTVRLVDDKSELLNSSIASQSIGGDIALFPQSSAGGGGGVSSSAGRTFSPSVCWFIIKVIPHRSDSFLIKRSFDNMQMLDEMLHRCVYDRKVSGLKDLHEIDFKSEEDVEYAVAKYLERFSKIASDSLTCGTILTWLQLDNKGRRLPLADTDTMRSINTPAVGAAYGVRRYTAQASDEISIEVGDMISVIDMPSPAESIWWRGKKSHLQKSHYEVGFFPQSCVATIGDKVPRHFPLPAPLVGQLDVSPTKPVLRKHGKLIAFFRSFILSRPSRRRLKQTGIYRERVFSCDLSEHLLNSGQEIPMVLKCCAEFIEENGIVDGIYRLSGITSNIQKLRRAFDEERIPDLANPDIRQDIHAVSSLLKMYFRELPNPLCTYQLYDNFVEAIQAKGEANERLRMMKETVLKLPPPHYRTLKYLASHLNKISQHSARTGMTDKNLAIVWAPNLLRSPALESGGVAALRGVGVQAVVTEYLIRNCHLIFDPNDECSRLSYAGVIGGSSTAGGCAGGGGGDQRMDSLTDCESLLVEQREHDQSLSFMERPKSLSASGPKLISLEEAQERQSRLDSYDANNANKSIAINVTSNASNIGSYIEVGGGPSSLPDKYHTVLPVPRSWQKRKTHSWKSLFSRNPRSSSSNHDMKALNTANNCQRHKENAQVTFAEPDCVTETDHAGHHHHQHIGKNKQDKPKSVDLFEASNCKAMEICVRSSSIDSLRTTGHSRSVSHDSYFDLLQSPQRGMTTCPSRELSELGLNFDREEPEMRIFSESESLVSSPKVGKENIPPSRRVLRARPEEFSSTTNSVNPSPKKQPRLNLLLAPNNAATTQQQQQSQVWSSHQAIASVNVPCPDHMTNDESCCKRYKLEDQLSDIQYIDCNTPEHTIANSATLFTNVQIHNPPKVTTKTKHTSADIGAGGVSGDQQEEKSSGSASSITPTKNTTFESIFENKDKAGDCSLITTRYSYPTVQLGAKRKENDTSAKERFSYPGSSGNYAGKYVCRLVSKDVKMNVADGGKVHKAKNETPINEVATDLQQQRGVKFSKQYWHHLPKPAPELLRPKNRYSYCDTNDNSHQSSAISQQQLNFLLLRSNSAELTKEPRQINEMERSKLSVTPSSPIQSPRYSLLVGDTSSENSSTLNTPQYEMDSAMMTSGMSGLVTGNSQYRNQYHQRSCPHSLEIATTKPNRCCDYNDDTKDFTSESSCCLRASEDSICSNATSHNSGEDNRDMNAIKRELSLDLNFETSPSTVLVGATRDNSTRFHYNKLIQQQQQQHQQQLHQNQQQQQLIPSPNNSNFTHTSDNTSQSVTPSEFGYHQLNRQSNVHSFENSPHLDEYETIEQSFLNYDAKSLTTLSNAVSPSFASASASSSTCKFEPKTSNIVSAISPIKSTISITYNLKSPKDESNEITPVAGNMVGNIFPKATISDSENDDVDDDKQLVKPLLETSFDENIVYEQVKLFRNSVTEVNKLLNNNKLDKYPEMTRTDKQVSTLRRININDNPTQEVNSNNLINLSDPDEEDDDDDDGGGGGGGGHDDIQMSDNLDDSLECDSSCMLYENIELRKPPIVYENMKIGCCVSSRKNLIEQNGEIEEQVLQQKKSEKLSTLLPSPDPRRSPSNFSVKQLAIKFETSPVDQLPQFDFSIRHSTKRFDQKQTKEIVNNRSMSSAANKPKLTKSVQHTRSLDENAFVREFGPKRLEDLAKSAHQIEKIDEITNRRKSFDFTKPKLLNPPKRLPGMPINEEVCQQKNDQISTTSPIKTATATTTSLKLDFSKSIPKLEKQERLQLEHEYESAELKITPTTENRISLIQNNVELRSLDESINSSNLSNSLKVLSGVKLDRERIDKIKEERRHQLKEKYRTESFKSKSKTELRDFIKDEKFQSESLRVKSKSRGDMRNLQKDIDNLKEGRSETTLLHYSNRVRSISDEKNQNNCCDMNNITNTMTTTTTIAKKTNSNTNSNSNINTDETIRWSLDEKLQKSPQPAIEEFSARATAQRFETKNMDLTNASRDRKIDSNCLPTSAAQTREVLNHHQNTHLDAGTRTSNTLLTRNSISSTREKISPQFSIRDVTAMFESRSQNQQ